jgi:two-component system response regulator AlgR
LAAVPLQLLIVDDEPLARLRLRTLIADVQASAAPGAAPWEVAGEAASADEAMRLLGQHSVHALLLDIHMPGRNGLQLAQALRAMAEPPAVVFVTAHDEHALQAFELHAVDYLTKPVRRERLAEALQRLADRVQREPAAPAPGSAAGSAPQGPYAHNKTLDNDIVALNYDDNDDD